jgi:hypothetical protein
MWAAHLCVRERIYNKRKKYTKTRIIAVLVSSATCSMCIAMVATLLLGRYTFERLGGN